MILNCLKHSFFRLNRSSEFFVIHVSIFSSSFSSLQFTNIENWVNDDDVRLSPIPETESWSRGRSGEGEGRREGDSFSPGCPLSRAIVVIFFFSILPDRGGESGHGRNGDGLFEWEMPPWIHGYFFVFPSSLPTPSENVWATSTLLLSRIWDNPNLETVLVSFYLEYSIARRRNSIRFWIVWYVIFFCVWRTMEILNEIGKLEKRGRGSKYARRLVVSRVKFLGRRHLVVLQVPLSSAKRSTTWRIPRIYCAYFSYRTVRNNLSKLSFRVWSFFLLLFSR